MKQYITSSDIANQVRMMRTAFDGAVVIVEGDTDARVYKRFIGETCRIVPAFGKSNALDAMANLDKTSFAGALAIVDSDFWQLDGVEPPGHNVFATDTHDLETMIVASRAFDAVMDEFGSARSIKRLDGDIREMLVRTAMPVGFLRWISSSKQDNLSLRFKNLSFAPFIDMSGNVMKLDVDGFATEVRKQSGGVPASIHSLKIRLRRLMKDNSYDPWHVCRGHDLVQILTIGLRDMFGNRHAKNITYEQVDRILRISFSYMEFSRTRLYASLVRWESNHTPYAVFPSGRDEQRPETPSPSSDSQNISPERLDTTDIPPDKVFKSRRVRSQRRTK